MASPIDFQVDQLVEVVAVGGAGRSSFDRVGLGPPRTPHSLRRSESGSARSDSLRSSYARIVESAPDRVVIDLVEGPETLAGCETVEPRGGGGGGFLVIAASVDRTRTGQLVSVVPTGPARLIQRRKHFRHNLAIGAKIEVLSATDVSLSGRRDDGARVIDASAGGVGAATSLALVEGDRVSIALEPEADALTRASRVVRWTALEGPGGRRFFAAAFVGLDQDSEEQLARTLCRLAVEHRRPTIV